MTQLQFKNKLRKAVNGFSKLGIATAAGTVILSLVTVAPSMAASIAYSGNTIGAPTWNRPNQGNPPTSPLSSTATNVAYSYQGFTVNTNGTYNFSSVVSPGANGNWQNALFLYQNSFNAATPLANVLRGRDSEPDDGSVSLSRTLTAGINYFLVTTGVSNQDSGAFTNTIAGSSDSTITKIAGNGSTFVPIPPAAPVPEPLTMIGWGSAIVLGGALKRKFNLKDKAIAAKAN